MKKRTVFSRCLLLLLTVVLILGLVPAASAAKVTKATKTYEIAVVFDNSGSMYAAQNGPAWCQAKYAMEIFASMIDYENGDKMTVFPMWEVVTDKNKIPKQTESDLKGLSQAVRANKENAIKITSIKDVEKIHNMYTPVAGGTPIETVEDAYEFLEKSKANEKWLVILTDGVMQRNGKDMLDTEVESTLKGLAGDDIKVQYIPFNKDSSDAYALPPDTGKNFYSSVNKQGTPIVITSGKALEEEVVTVCNRIFRRDVLTEGLSGNALNLKISMSKLIVFAQGDANVTLKKDEKPISSSADSGQRTYSELSNGGFVGYPYDNSLYTPVVDKSLAGRIITYSDLEKGDYTIECTGSMEIFYEPGVTLQVTLTDPNGKVVEFDPKEDEATVEPGNYTVQVKLIDKVTGEDVTNNPLMGNVKIGITATVNKETRTVENGGTLALEPETDVKVNITGTYLEDYTITNDEDSSIFPPKINVEKSKALTVKAEVPGDGWYSLMEKKNWKPIRLELQLEGEKLTEEQMKALTLNGTVKSGKEVALRYEPLNGESAVLVYVGQAEDGSFVKPAKGARDVTFEASVPSKFSKPYTASKTVAVNVKGLPKWVVIGMVSLAGLLLLLLVLLILNIKVLPKKIFRDTAEFISATAGTLDQNFVNVQYSRKGRSLTIHSTSAVASDEKCTVTFKLKPSDPLRKKSAERHYEIVGINSNCASVSINSVEYVKNEKGTWVKETMVDSPKAPPISHDGYRIMVDLVRVSGGVTTGTLNCKVKTK